MVGTLSEYSLEMVRFTVNSRIFRSVTCDGFLNRVEGECCVLMMSFIALLESVHMSITLVFWCR